MTNYTITVNTFKMGTEKEAALKPLEEASEAFGAWQLLNMPELIEHNKEDWIINLADEIADTIQAACNLAQRYNIDLQAAMKRCEEKNRARGRY